ncbi:hypothetical protein, partial [uncultured Clostridium sp.]|uniref:hypothetical protein n=1 Tax=uncultured Clostridium sp. TaxID=59620 RepID=UPI002593DB03
YGTSPVGADSLCNDFYVMISDEISARKVPEIFSIILTPRRETYYLCESLIFKAFNGDYYTFYHNYFMFSKIQVSYGYYILIQK